MTPPLNSHDGHDASHSPLGHVEEWESSAVDYLESRLSPGESSTIADHLAACEACRDRLAEQRWMIQLLAAVEPAEVPPDLESRVFEGFFPAPAPLPLRQATEPGVLRRLLTGAARRPWVPAAIAAVVVMVAIAGSGDVIRSGGGADTARSGLSAPMAAGTATTAAGQAEAFKSTPPSTAAASLSAAEAHDAAGNTAGALDAPGTETTVPSLLQSLPPQTTTGDQAPTETTAASVTTVTAGPGTFSDGGPAAEAAQTAAPTVWASVEVAVGDANAAAAIEEITGLHPLALQSAPGVPIYAAMIRRGSIDEVLRQFSDAGLAVTLSTVPQPPLDTASIQAVQELSGLPYVEPVSPQGDTLSPTMVSPADDTLADYVLMVLSAVR